MLYIVCWIHALYWLDIGIDPFRSIFLIEMPIVFFIMGATLRLQQGDLDHDRKHNAVQYIKRRIGRLYTPYCAYALACAVFAVYASSEPVIESMPNALLSWLNPFTYGKNWTYYYLNWHLWFMPVLLIVNLALFFITKTQWCRQAKITQIYGVCFIALGLQQLFDIRIPPIIQSAVFYSTFALIGYKCINHVASIKQIQQLALLSAILLAGLMMGDTSFNMQENKFPPNFVFLLFSTIGLVATLIPALSFQALADILARLMNTPFIRLFKTAGYSIYLWQGMGFTLASIASQKLGLHVLLNWLIAVLLSVLLGFSFSFLEKIRTSKTRPPPLG